jgi:hypothetical protein
VEVCKNNQKIKTVAHFSGRHERGGNMSGTSGAPTSWEFVCRPAAGRRRYNAERKHRKQARQTEIILRMMGRAFWGMQALLAESLGVSRATISRDFHAIRNWKRGALLK